MRVMWAVPDPDVGRGVPGGGRPHYIYYIILYIIL